ncbi:oxygen-regulated protein 1 [Acanthochromis polyacanthus]|uniref:oxygen-regulated protein 1 n=1 Tax=Acanthochromis polyacanthus TaxID=80966 RepID=UPI002234AB39|nr:oxygen-regulated protein 1 [Acanthochromis polyacanthus]
MSTTPVQEGPAQGLSSSSGQTLPSRPLQPLSDPSASKRVCFYKSGDYKFSGHRMVINARTFKTFDALLDALSKKVPLPFGVRTITTPRGTHLVKALDDLHDGGAYVCSDQKRVKPLNLDEVNRRQVPWNTTRPVSAGRRKRQGLRLGELGRANEASNRPAKVTERVAVRTPKRLTVIKNKDPTVKRTIVLQRRTAPTFDALLDYLSQILQFPVLKLYSTDSRRVESLAALILCSGVVVAAGKEPFRLGNYHFNRAGQMAEAMYVENVDPSMLQHRAQKNKSFSSGRGSRNFSLSSERYIVNQINKSQTGGMNGHLHQQHGPFEADVHQHQIEASGRGASCIVPQDDDIEKSFRVNQDGSMTVEMKVHLTIKEEEMLHWTTTLSRSSLIKRSVCTSIPESGNSSPDSNTAVAKASLSTSGDEAKEENYPAGAGKGVGFNEQIYEGYTSAPLGKVKKSFKRTSTPGPRHVNKTASVESVKMVTETGVQESTLGHYSYMERTADGETTEGYCVVRHSSSSSNRPIPKPRKTASAGGRNKHSNSSIRSSGVAEVLQIENNGMEVTETVMHIYESQGCYDNYFANDEYSADDLPLHGSTVLPESKPSTDSGPRSSYNDCDIDCSWQPPTAESLQRQKEEMLSLSSEPVSPRHQITNNLSSVTQNEVQTATNSQSPETVKKDNSSKSMKKRKIISCSRNQKSSTSTSSTDNKAKEHIISSSKNSKHSSTDKLSSHSSVRKKSLNSSDSAKSGQNREGAAKKAEMSQSKRSIKDEKMPRKDLALLGSSENVKRTPPKRQIMTKAVGKDNGHNINTATGRPQMKKNMSDILQTKKSSLTSQKLISKPKSMIENRISPPKKSLELSESVSMPALNPSPSQIHQYVEDWLEKVTPEAEPDMEEAIKDGAECRPNVVFQIGGDSESDEKTECQATIDECSPSAGDAIKKSASSLSVPFSYEGPAQLHSEQKARVLCVSMPSVRVDPTHYESNLRSHKSAEEICAADNEASSSYILSPKAKVKPVLRQLCSSIQCIRRASDINTPSNLEKSNSVPDFPTQVASVFGSSCKAFMTFLSVMTLRDNLNPPASGESSQSRSTSEAMLMMESLQKISAIEDDEEQRASLTDLQSRASSQLRERWKNFQILRERFESEPLSPKVSETEFALDVVSEGGDVFDERIDELMDELNMPEDLRAEITSTFQQAKSFYPVEESSLMETDRHHSDSEEDVEQFVKQDETKLSAELDSTNIAEDVSETLQGNDEAEIDYLNKMDTPEEQTIRELEQEPNEIQVSQTERDESSIDKQNDIEENNGEVEELEGMKNTEVLDSEDEENKKDDSEREDEAAAEVVEDDEKNDELEEWKAEKGSGEESVEKEEEESEEEMTMDEGEVDEGLEEGEKEVGEETEEGSVDEDTGEDDSVEETDEREGDEETVEEENSEEEETEEKQGDEISKEKEDEEELDEIMEEADEEEEPENKHEVEEEEEEKDEKSEEEVEEDTEVHDEEKEMEGVIEEKDEEEEAENINEEIEEEAENITAEIEDEVENINEEMEGEVENITAEIEDEVENINEEMEGEEREDAHADTAKDVEEEVNDEAEREEEKEMEVDIEEEDEEHEEDVEEKEEEKEQVTEVVSEENEDEEKEEREQKEEHGGQDSEDAEIKNTEETSVKVITDEEEEDCDKDVEEEEKYVEVEDSGNITADSVEEREPVEELEGEENVTAGQTVDEEERNDDDKEFDEELDQVEEQSKDEADEVNVAEESCADDEDCRSMPEEAFHQQQHDSSCEEADSQQNTESPTKYSSEGQCEDDKGNGTDTVNETDEAGERCEEGSSSTTHPVEISQELLDFVNNALQSSSLVFTYDTQGNIRIEPDNARVTQNKQTVIPKTRKDSSYGLKRLPSPSTSDLSDYRPETSESGGYKTQESVDIVSESGEEGSEKASPVHKDSAHRTARTNAQQAKVSVASNSEALHSSQQKGSGSFSSSDSATKALGEDMSYFSAASSSKTDAAAAIQATQSTSFVSEKDTADGVLIDQGRWLLKENHLIRKSPPVSLGMYGNLDSTSIDTGQENNGEDSPVHSKTQHSPLAAISSSELEEMAKPQTPRCTYFNMPHGSDSDPFMDDSFVKSGKKDSISFKGRGVRVSPTVDTSKTWANKNGSLSSFASVEFKISDRKVHPEGESSAVTQARRTSSGGGHALQAQDSLETLHVRCGQYCPIL